jgi:hypothetical protein
MRHSHVSHFAAKVRNQGIAMWRTARHVGSIVDRTVHTAAQVYGQLAQPALRSAGYDTSAADNLLKSNYDLYNTYAQALNDGTEVIDGIARHLRGGTMRYH